MCKISDGVKRAKLFRTQFVSNFVINFNRNARVNINFQDSSGCFALLKNVQYSQVEKNSSLHKVENNKAKSVPFTVLNNQQT